MIEAGIVTGRKERGVDFFEALLDIFKADGFFGMKSRMQYSRASIYDTRVCHANIIIAFSYTNIASKTSIPLLHQERHRLQLVLQLWHCKYHRLSEAGKQTIIRLVSEYSEKDEFDIPQ